MLPSGKFARFALAIALLLTGLVILVVERAGHLASSPLLSDLLQRALVAGAGISAVRATARSSGYLRRLWLLLTVSLGLVIVAQVLETYYENIAHTHEGNLAADVSRPCDSRCVYDPVGEPHIVAHKSVVPSPFCVFF